MKNYIYSIFELGQNSGHFAFLRFTSTCHMSNVIFFAKLPDYEYTSWPRGRQLDLSSEDLVLSALRKSFFFLRDISLILVLVQGWLNLCEVNSDVLNGMCSSISLQHPLLKQSHM